MNFVSKIFSGKKGKTLSPSEAIQQLRETEDILIRKQAYLEQKIDQEIAIAKKNASTNKRAGLTALKRKKRYEDQLNQIDGTLSTIESQLESIQNTNINRTTVKLLFPRTRSRSLAIFLKRQRLQSSTFVALGINTFNVMKTAANALKKAHKKFGVDKIHNVMDEVSEQRELSREVSDAIPTSAIGQDYDELEQELMDLEQELMDLEQELMDLEQEELDKELLSTGQSEYSLPEVPTGDIKVPTPASHGKENVRVNQPIEEDDDLRELSAWGN